MTFENEFKQAVTLPTGLWSRWWFTKGDQSYDAIYNDMKESIVDAGIVRIELAKGFVWTDSEENMAAFYYVLKAASELGLKMDIATGTPYPAEVGVKPLVVNGKTYYDPTAIGYTPELCNSYSLSYAIAEFREGQTAVSLTNHVAAFARKMFFLPAELLPDQTISLNKALGERVVGVAGICLDSDGRTILASCDLSDRYDPEINAIAISPSDLSAITNYTGEGTWKLLSFYTQLQERNSVCYLNCNATHVWKTWFESGVIDNDAYWTEVMNLPDGEVRKLFNEVVSGLWEDSLEAIPVGYTAHAKKTIRGDIDIFSYFEEVCGYRLSADQWPALFVGGNGLYNMSTGVADDADFIRDPVQDKRIRHDFFHVLTKLYCENHLDVYTAWAKAQPGNLDTRIQAAYLYALDQDMAYHSVTIPEYESLNSSDRPDCIRAVAGAAHTAGANTVSYEMGARSVSFQKETYSMQWRDWLWHANVGFVHGINATVLHGIEYLYGRSAKVWPGPCMAMPFAALSEPCGQRMPYWELMSRTVSPYLARSQYLLHHGAPCMDVAVYYYYNEILNDYLEHWNDPELSAAGYCYDFIGDTSLHLAAESLDESGRFLSRGGYRAIIINQYRSGIKPQSATGPSPKKLKEFKGNGYISPASARTLLALAKKGFPIVIVGRIPDKAAQHSDAPLDAFISSCFEEIIRLPNGVLCENEAMVPDVLRAMHITPAAELKGENTRELFTFHRKSNSADVYMLFNRTHTIRWKDQECDPEMLNVEKDRHIEADIILTGEGDPYKMDCWTGEIYSVPFDRIDAHTVKLHLAIAPSEAVMILVGYPNATSKPTRGDLISTVELTDWSLDLALYRPTEKWLEQPTVSSSYHKSQDDGMTTIVTETICKIDPIRDGRFIPWKELNALGAAPERASGIGIYSSDFVLPEDFDVCSEIITMEITEAHELFVVTVNGTDIQYAQGLQCNYIQEITKAVHPGKNHVEITVAGGLWNAAKYYNTLAHKKNPEIIPQLSQEDYIAADGIIGTVSISRFHIQI